MNDYSKLSSGQLRELLWELQQERDLLRQKDAELKAQLMPFKDELDRRERARQDAKRHGKSL
jgi:hypothetical protein